MKQKICIFIFSTIFFISIFISHAQAATVTVNSLLDDGDGTCTSTCTLRDAIANSSEGDTVEFGVVGTIFLTEGYITIPHALFIVGPGADELTINGNADTNNYFDQNSGDLSVSGLKFENFTTSGTGVFFSWADADLIISNSIFRENTGNDYGVAAYFGGTGSLTISGTDFIDNSTIAPFGCGVIEMESGDVLTVTDSSFSGNTSEGSCSILDVNSNTSIVIDNVNFIDNTNTDQGGAMAVGSTDSMSITNSTFSGNISSQYGGAFSVGQGDVVITDSVFTGNSSVGDGGAIYFSSDGTFSVNNSTFVGNTTTGASYGSAIAHEITGTMIITNSTFDSNNGENYGVVYNSQGILEVTNSTFANNDSTDGGSAGIEADGGITTITNSTFYNNTNGVGTDGVITTYGGDVEIINSILFTEADDNCYVASGTITSLGHNIDSGDSCGFNQETDLSETDPKLDPNGLQDNGGEVETIALTKNSSAINAGDDEQAPELDARGKKRIGTSDIGAYEYKPASSGGGSVSTTRPIIPTVVIPPEVVTSIPTPQVCTIIFTLKLGSKGDEVKCLQTILNLPSDGIFGPKTKAAVIIFQSSHNLTPDGVVGPKTRGALSSTL